MREGFRHDIALRFLLQTVIADGGGSVEAFLDIALGLGLPALGLVAQWSSVGTVFLVSAAIVLCALFMTARLLSAPPPA